jgi:hypothetical protein
MTDVIDLECHRLHEFLDGELGAVDAERFRMHLALCDRCGAEMPRLLELAAASAEAARDLRREDVHRRRSRRAVYVVSAGVAVVAAAVVVLVGRVPQAPVREPVFAAPDRSPVFVSLSASRTVEVRLSYAGAAAYRPYRVSRGDAAREDVSLKELVQLERAGDWHGLAAASLLRGDRAGAARYLERAGRSSAADTDRAALELLDGSEAALDRALNLLDAVLVAEPENQVARWNRALVLARLDLPLAAARELDRVVAGGEPGWSTEAAQRARALRAEVEPRRSAWEATDAAGKRWIAGDGPIDPPANAPRGSLQYLFYDAVRAADSRARVEALLPLAGQLDALHGGDALTRYVRGVAGSDFRARAPLAAAYREGVLERVALDGRAIEELAARMEAAGARDLWMGLLARTYTVDGHVDWESAE